MVTGSTLMYMLCFIDRFNIVGAFPCEFPLEAHHAVL